MNDAVISMQELKSDKHRDPLYDPKDTFAKLIGTSKPLLQRTTSPRTKSLDSLNYPAPRTHGSLSMHASARASHRSSMIESGLRPSSASSNTSLSPLSNDSSKAKAYTVQPSSLAVLSEDSMIKAKEFAKVGASSLHTFEKYDDPTQHRDSKYSLSESSNDFERPFNQAFIGQKEDFDSSLDLAFDVKSLNIDSMAFNILPLQSHIYNKVYPHPDDATNELGQPSNYPHLIHEMYSINCTFIDLAHLHATLSSCIKDLCILRCKLIRNDRIIDADVEGVLKEVYNGIHSTDVISSLTNNSSPPIKSMADLSTCAETWLLHNRNINPALRIAYTAANISDANSGMEKARIYLMFVTTSALLDQISLSTIARLVLSRYTDPSTHKEIPSYHAATNTTRLAINNLSNTRTKARAYEHWRSQIYDTVHPNLPDTQRHEMQAQIVKLNADHDRTTKMITSLRIKRTTLERQLLELKQQRLDLEPVLLRSSHNLSVVSDQGYFIDPSTYERVYIPKSIRAHILTKILNNEGDENLCGYLLRRDISMDTLHRVFQDYAKSDRQDTMACLINLEQLCGLVQGQMTYLELHDQQSLTRISEMVRNAVKDALHAQKALGYNVERRISKLERELKHLLTVLHTTQRQFELSDELRIRTYHKLNPQTITSQIFPLKIEKNNFDSILVNDNDMSQQYECLTFAIDQEILLKLRQFQDYLLTLERSSAPSSSRQPGCDTDKLQQEQQNTKVDAVCLSAFAVILRHITGNENFLVGVKQDYRNISKSPNPDSIKLGPLSDTVLMKIDLRDKAKTLNALVLQMHDSIEESRDHGLSLPSLMLRECDLGCDGAIPPVCFEYIDNNAVQAMRADFVSLSDIDHLLSGNKESSIDATALQCIWSREEAHPFDLKLKIEDLSSELRCMFVYRRDMFTADKVCRWAEKFENILWQVEYDARKLSISHIISRLYNRVWQGSSRESRESLGSSRESFVV